MTGDGYLWVSVSEAARLTGKSERTVRRWMAGGRLQKKDNVGELVVGVPPDLVTYDRQGRTTSDNAPLQTETLRLQAEVDKLSEIVRQLTGERDYLRQALAAALTAQQKALPEHTARPWWALWRRSEKEI